MPVYFILNWITGSILWSSFLYSILQITVINLVVLSIFKKIAKTPFRYLFLTNTLLCLFPLCELINDNFLFVFYFLSNSYHLGSFVLTLLILNITLRHLKQSNWLNLIWIGLLSFAGAMSDFLFIISATVPLALTSLLLFKTKIKETLLINVVSIFGVIAGLSLLNSLQNNGIIQLDKANSFLNTENIIPSLKEFGYQTYVNLTKLDFSSLIILLSFFSLILLTQKLIAIISRKQDVPSTEKWFVLFLSFTIYCLLTSPILAGNFTGPDTIRYNYHAYILLIAILPYLSITVFRKWTKKTFTINYRLLVIIQGTLLLYFIVSLSFSGSNYFKFYPKKAETADKFCEETGLKTGAGSYWDAKLITMFSKKEVVILCTFENLIPYDHVANRSWFFRHPTDSIKRMEIEFNILENNTRQETLNKQFGDSSNSYWSSNGETYIVHPKYCYSDQLKVTPVNP